MKKIIACGLLLSLLASVGTLCFAFSGGYMDGGHWIEVDDDEWCDTTDEDDADDPSYEDADEDNSSSEGAN